MCLHINSSIAEQVKKRLEEDGEIIGYKFVTKNKHQTVYQGTYYNKSTTVCSDRLSSALTNQEKNYGVIHRGIHVFLDEKSAARHMKAFVRPSPCKVIKVLCKKEDFVAAGTFDGMLECENTVFMKVSVLDESKKGEAMKTVKNIVENFLANGTNFTAFDVTKALRDDKQQVYHSKVKEEVHNLMQNYLSSGQCTSRQHAVYPAIEYVPIAVSAVPAQNVVGTGPVPVDKRGRLCLPKSLVASLKPGQYVYVGGDNQGVRVSATPTAGGNYRYKVDKDGNVRVSKNALKSVLGKEYSKFSVVQTLNGELSVNGC